MRVQLQAVAACGSVCRQKTGRRNYNMYRSTIDGDSARKWRYQVAVSGVGGGLSLMRLRRSSALMVVVRVTPIEISRTSVPDRPTGAGLNSRRESPKNYQLSRRRPPSSPSSNGSGFGVSDVFRSGQVRTTYSTHIQKYDMPSSTPTVIIISSSIIIIIA